MQKYLKFLEEVYINTLCIDQYVFVTNTRKSVCFWGPVTDTDSGFV